MDADDLDGAVGGGDPGPADEGVLLREPHFYAFLQNLLLIILGLTVARQRRLLHILRNTQFGRLLRISDAGLEDEDDDDADFNPNRGSRRRRRILDPDRFPKVPSEKGAELMNSGAFGADPAYSVTSNDRNSLGKKKKLALRILERELAIQSPARQKLNQRLMAQVKLAAEIVMEVR